ncbi:MAG: hypothetical protein ACPG7F_00650 [Aggregatilineales bacterium]
MFNFKPDEKQGIDAPFIEDARADFAPYYRSRENKNINQAQHEVLAELAKLGAGGRFVDGVFDVDGQERYGYILHFYFAGLEGVIPVVGLPIRNKTKVRVEAVRIQALLILRDWLKASVTKQVFSPGSAVLVPYLLVDGQRTVTQFLLDEQRMPQLPEIVIREVE